MQPESIANIDLTSVSNAQAYWSSKFGSDCANVKCAIAPHVLQLMECCNLAVDRYCVVIGVQLDKHPKSVTDHKILDLDDHPDYDKTIYQIRSFLKLFDLQNAFMFHIENPFGVDGRLSIGTVLVAVWKFLCLFVTSLEHEDLITSTMEKLSDTQNLRVSRGEVAAIVQGRPGAFFSGWIDDFYVNKGNNQTELEVEQVDQFFEEFDVLFLQTSLSRTVFVKTNFFRMRFIELLRCAIRNKESDAPIVVKKGSTSRGKVPYVKPPPKKKESHTSVASLLLTYSESRIHRRNFSGCDHEKSYQKVLTEATNRCLVEGGAAQPGGIIFVTKKNKYESFDFMLQIREIIWKCNLKPTFITIEKFQPGDGARSVVDNDDVYLTKKIKKIVPIEESSSYDIPGCSRDYSE